MNRVFRSKRVSISLFLPALMLFVFAILAPICLSLYYGMTEYSGMGTPVFVGLKNFKEILFHDSTFWKSLWHSILLALGFVLIQHPLALGMAILLDKIGGKWEKFFRVAYFIPNVISVTVIASMWVFIYNPSFGLLNTIFGKLGLNSLMLNWLGPNMAIWSVLFVLIWHGFGWGMLIYYAGYKGIDHQLYEAAAIDGTSGLKMHISITIPLMMPMIRVNVTLAIIAALKQMETVYLLTNGGPGDNTQFLANYLYKKAFSSYEYGYGNAISVLFVIICILITLGINKVFKIKSDI